ncbi:MAG: heavy-metal-associated domain-containing protein [Bacteroidota bacterium]
MKHNFLILALMLLTFGLSAQEKNKKMSFEVDGVCQMCKARIEKAALNVNGVKYAVWDIPTHELALIVDERKTNAMEIKSALVAAGHDTKELKATEEAYNDLHFCCRYRDIDADKDQKH